MPSLLVDLYAAEIFAAGLTVVFDELDNEADFPAQTVSMHQVRRC